MKLYGESDAATIFLNFAHLATGIMDFKSHIQGGTHINIKYAFIVFKMTAQNTQTDFKKLNPFKAAIRRRNLRKQSTLIGLECYLQII